MPDWNGDQMAGVGPEGMHVFGRNAQIADVPAAACERAKSDPKHAFEMGPMKGRKRRESGRRRYG
jgi:hypothetical protein